MFLRFVILLKRMSGQIVRSGKKYIQRNGPLIIYRLHRNYRRIWSENKGNHSEILFDTIVVKSRNNWIFHDEHWNRVIHRWEHRRIVSEGRPLDILDNEQEINDEVLFLDDGTLLFNGQTKTNDEWIYLYLEPDQYPWENYTMRFRIRRDSYFKEFQFGFRYNDFYNRYRYRIEDDAICFDKVVKGQFLNEFSKAKFKMDLGIWYNMRIDVFGNHFKCFINDALMLDDFDFQNHFPKGSIAVILWEKNGKTDIKAAVGPIAVYKLD